MDPSLLGGRLPPSDRAGPPWDLSNRRQASRLTQAAHLCLHSSHSSTGHPARPVHLSLRRPVALKCAPSQSCAWLGAQFQAVWGNLVASAGGV